MTELEQALNQLLLILATAAIGYAVKLVRDYVNSIKNEKLRAEVDKALVNAINWARAHAVANRIPTVAETTSGAVQYMYDNLPGIIASLGLDKDSVRKLIEARLAKGV